jgi:phytoene dehydrogenase-like protein
VVVVGAGHNGLVAAVLLARAGLSVRVFEAAPVVGGAARTEYPFGRAPGVGASTGAYLLGLAPPELLDELGLELPLIRRDPHYFLPTTGSKYLLFGSDQAELERQFLRFFSAADLRAHRALQAELDALRQDIAPTWLRPPLGIEETAERYVRKPLRQVFVALCRGSIADYLGRFGFQSDLVRAMYAVTDAFSGLFGSWDSPGTGMNFLVHNMCRLPGSDGTWMVVRGGMGTVTSRLADKARAAGASIETHAEVAAIVSGASGVTGVRLADGREFDATVVVVGADPFRMRELAGAERFPDSYNQRLSGYARPGSTMKVNLCLRGLPTFTCLPEDRGQFRTTIHLLPDEADVIGSLNAAFADARAGRLPEFPAIEWYTHTTVDPSLGDDRGRHNGALFVQWVPYQLAAGDWSDHETRYAEHLLRICDRFAPGTSDLVEDMFILHPQKIESHFGITAGHIHHVDNSFGFADRVPYATPLAGLYAASAGCHPAGSVIGAAGHNCARRVLEDLAVDSR